jgi:hypothetical protein
MKQLISPQNVHFSPLLGLKAKGFSGFFYAFPFPSSHSPRKILPYTDGSKITKQKRLLIYG